MTMVDLEHCFLNLALEVANLPDPLNPGAIDALGPAALQSLTKKRVLTPRTLPRTRGEFFDVRAVPAEVSRACEDGFLESYREIKSRGDAICDLIGRRLYERPYLVIGTRGYRRAMARIDLDDIRERIAADPGPVLVQVMATRT